MTNERQDNERERWKDRVVYIKDHVEDDLKINKNLSGVDFSTFLGQVIGIYSALSMDRTKRSKDLMILLGPFGISIVREELEKKLGRPVSFHETDKTGLALWECYNDRCEEIDAFTRDLYARELSPRDREINLEAIRMLSEYSLFVPSSEAFH